MAQDPNSPDLKAQSEESPIFQDETNLDNDATNKGKKGRHRKKREYKSSNLVSDLISFAFHFAMGVWALTMSSYDVECNRPLLRWALSIGILYLIFALSALVSICNGIKEKKRNNFENWGSVLGILVLGYSIAGVIHVFVKQDEIVCDDKLYKQAKIFVFIIWSALIFICAFGICLMTCLCCAVMGFGLCLCCVDTDDEESDDEDDSLEKGKVHRVQGTGVPGVDGLSLCVSKEKKPDLMKSVSKSFFNVGS